MTNRRPRDSEEERSGEPAGNDHAQRISRLFSEHNESLIQFLATRLHSVQEAKEVAQEAPHPRPLALARARGRG